jgi:MFS family permease
MNQLSTSDKTQSASVDALSPNPGKKLFYGWWIVVGCFFILVVSVGAGLYSLPIFLVPLQEHFGWSRTSISIGAAIASISIGLMAPWIGVIIERFGMRPMMFVGSLIMAFGFVGYASMMTLWHFWLASAVVATGLSMVAFVPVQTLISYWFSRRRGVAMGLTLAGIGLGGLTLVPITGMVISIYGWRIAYMALGISILLPVSIILLLVIRDSPGVMGLQPDGDVPITQAGEDVTSDVSEILSLELGEAVRSGAFWILTVVVFATSFTSFGIIQHLSALLTDIGYTPAIAASTLGSAIGLSVIGRIVSGALSDRWGAQWVCSALVALITLSAVALLWADHKLALITFSLCFGLGLGGYNVLLPLLVGMCFGLKAFSKILGVIIFAATIGSSLGPLIVGMLFDVHGDYRIALLVMISLGLVGMITVTFIHRPTMR